MQYLIVYSKEIFSRLKTHFLENSNEILFVFVGSCIMKAKEIVRGEDLSEIIRNCRLCKQPMESSPFMMCPACLTESDRVQSFIRKHPLTSMEEISCSTKVPPVKLEKMLHLGIRIKRESTHL